MLAEGEAEKAIVKHLVTRPTVRRPEGQIPPSGWTSSTVYAGGEGADPATIQFVKTKTFSSCQLHQVTFINHAHRSTDLLIKTWQEGDDTWTVGPLGGGEGGRELRRSQPLVNFTAGFGAEGFTAGRWVIGDGAEQASLVRLTFANGVTIEDGIEGGAVLFFEPRIVSFPADVVILDYSGRPLVTYKAFDYFPFHHLDPQPLYTCSTPALSPMPNSWPLAIMTSWVLAPNPRTCFPPNFGVGPVVFTHDAGLPPVALPEAVVTVTGPLDAESTTTRAWSDESNFAVACRG